MLTNVISWVGVATGIVGAIVIAPRGAVELVREAIDSVRRVLLRRKPPRAIGSADLDGASDMSAAPCVITSIDEDAPVEDQVRQLLDAINGLNQALLSAQQQSAKRDAELDSRIDQVVAGLQESDAAIRRQIAAAEHQEARFNARGLPLIGLGILMTGVAGILAEHAWIGWLSVAVAAIFVIFAAVWPMAACS